MSNNTPTIEMILLKEILERNKQIDKLSLNDLDKQIESLEELERHLLGLNESARAEHFRKTKDMDELGEMIDYFKRRDDVGIFDHTFFKDLAVEVEEG